MPRNPPPEFPVRTFPSPDIENQVLIEWVTSELANSKPIEPGTPIDKTREFPGFKLGVQRINPLDHNFTQRVWVRDATNEDVYNFALKYSGDNISAPVFVRTYREPKVSYTARTKGTALQTVYKLAVTNAGSGYIHGTKPVLTFSSGTATGYGIVAPDGTIAEFVLTSGGSYGSAPTFTVAAPSSGTTATGTASIQSTSAVLVEEEALQFPIDSEFYAQYFNVVRVYETLPGPLITTTRIDDDGVIVSVGKRRRLASDITSSEVIATGIWTRIFKGEGTSVVAEEISEARAVPGTAIITTAVTDGGERVTTTRTLVDATSITTANNVSGGTWTRTFKEKHTASNLVAWKVVVTQTDVFSRLFFSKTREDTIPERFKATVPAITTKIVLQGVASAPTLATGDLFRSEQQINAFTYERTITNRDISSLPTLDGQKYDEELNVLIPYTEQVIAAGSAIGNNATEVTPLGGGLDLVTIYDLTAIASAFATFQLVFPSKANLDLPDVLVDLELINEEHSGEGNSSTPTFSGFWSGAGSWSITPSGTATGSQAVTPELIPTIEPTYGNRQSTTRLVFLLPMPVTDADVLAKVAAIIGASVTDWPDFRPQPVHAVLTGRQISLQVHASYHVQDGGSGASNEEHSESFVRGFSTEVGMVIKTKEIGNTIHGNLGPFNPYTIASFDLTADAYYDSETQTTPALSTSVEVRGAGSTGGQTTIPATGKHLLDSNGAPYRFNHAMIHAEVFDFADL